MATRKAKSLGATMSKKGSGRWNANFIPFSKTIALASVHASSDAEAGWPVSQNPTRDTPRNTARTPTAPRSVATFIAAVRSGDANRCTIFLTIGSAWSVLPVCTAGAKSAKRTKKNIAAIGCRAELGRPFAEAALKLDPAGRASRQRRRDPMLIRICDWAHPN
jgi:hypothetical protein